MKINYHLLTMFEYDQTRNQTIKTTPPNAHTHNNRSKRLLFKASSYLSIGHSNVASCEGRDSSNSTFKQTLLTWKLPRRKSESGSPGEPNHRPGMAAWKISEKGEYIAIKCHNTPGDNDSGSYEINLPCYGKGTPKEWFVWKDKLLKALDGESISTEPLRYIFTERLWIGDAKATFNQAALDIDRRTVDNFNKVLAEMTKYSLPIYAFHEQKRYLCRNLVKPRSMKLHSFTSRLQESNVYLEEFIPDTEGQETAPLSAYEIMNIIYHSMPTTWKNKIIEQGFDYADSTIKEMTDFFETRVENLEP